MSIMDLTSLIQAFCALCTAALTTYTLLNLLHERRKKKNEQPKSVIIGISDPDPGISISDNFNSTKQNTGN